MPTQVNPLVCYETGFPNKHLVVTHASYEQMLGFLRTVPALIFDFETSGLAWFKHACACGIGLGAWDQYETLHTFYVPFRHATADKQLSIDLIHPGIGELLGNPNTKKIAHNMKFDEHMARKEGWVIEGSRYDTMIAARLYDENSPATLKGRAVSDLGRPEAAEFEKLVNAKVNELAKKHAMPVSIYRNTYGYSQVDVPLCGTYCCFDIEFTGQLFQLYENKKISTSYPRIWETEMTLTGVLCDMEERGMPIDVTYLETLRDALGGVLAGLEDSVFHQLGGYTFNMGSDDEMREFLINRLGLTLTKLTKKKQLSVDKDVLAGFVDLHPVLQQVIDWREAEKLYSTYTLSVLTMLDENKVLHTDFQQVGTYTGRLSCRRPNFQNQPSDSDKRAKLHTGKSLEDGGIDPWSIRRAYCTKGGEWIRLFFDYSQIELRVLAFYSGDPVMTNAYLIGEDIHSRTSIEVFGTKEKAKRRYAKIINFGIPYCITDVGLSRQIGIPVAEASSYLATFFERYAGIAEFRLKFWDEVRRNKGFFQNIFGRPRQVHNMSSTDEYKRTKAERKAIATIIQGTAAELTKESLVRIDHYLKKEKLPAYLVSTVHDEIQLDCHVSVMAQVCRKVKALMEDFDMFAPIPIVVDAEYTTTSWADKKSISL